MTEVKMSAEVTDESGVVHKLSLESLHERLSNVENVTVKNGTTKKLPTGQVIAEIWESTEILRDVNVVWRRIKKYRRFIYVIGAAIVSYFKWQDIIWILKEIF